jgi:hypothetical protein
MNIAQATCFDSKIMAQPFVFTEKRFKFSDQNTMRARYRVFERSKSRVLSDTQMGTGYPE